jgi:hypothetical protein
MGEAVIADFVHRGVLTDDVSAATAIQRSD